MTRHLTYAELCAAVAAYCGAHEADVDHMVLMDMQYENHLVLHDRTLLYVVHKPAPLHEAAVHKSTPSRGRH